MMHMLTSRAVSAEMGTSKITIKTTRGCPQRGILSPLMWCLVMDDLLTLLNLLGYETIGYADDLAVIVRSKDGSTISDRMQNALNHVSGWCRGEGLNANPSKTVLIPFTRRRILGLRSPNLNGV